MKANNKYSKSFSKRKGSYAPIILTSKAVKPLYRQQKNQLNNTQYSQNSQFRTKLAQFTQQQSHPKVINEDQTPSNNLNINVQNDQKKSNIQRLSRTFSYVNKDNRFHECKNSEFISNKDQQIESNKIQNQSEEDCLIKKISKQKALEYFSFKQTAASNFVKVEFNQQNHDFKVNRKNNNNIRYHTPFYNPSIPTRPVCRSVPHSTKNTTFHQVKQTEAVVELDEESKIRQSSSLRKNISVSSNKPTQSYLWIKDPSRKFMFSHKKNPFDLTFSNFKQKIYEKKVKRDENHRNKYNQVWNDYLHKYYLNIKKVRPLIKYESNYMEQTSKFNYLEQMKQGTEQLNKQKQQIDTKYNLSSNQKHTRESKSSAQVFLNQIRKIKKQENHNNPIKSNQINQNGNVEESYQTKPRSNTIVAASKTTYFLANKVLHPSSPQKIRKDSDLSKIQLDIVTKRINSNRKDHFVFGMGDSSNQYKNQNPHLLRFNLYKDFLWKVNFTNLIHVRMPDEIQKPYKFYVGRGNNSALIKGIMRRRFWWQIVDKISPQINFLWTQLRVNQFVKAQKKRKNQPIRILLNSKDNQYFYNDQKFSIQTQDLPQQLQQTFLLNKKIFKGKNLKLWLQNYRNNQKHQQKYLQEINFNILQKRLKSMIRKKKLTFWDSSSTFQQKTHNHFESNFYIGNKKALFYAMRKYYKLNGLDPFDFIPLTFHISGGLEDPEFNEFLDKYNIINEERMKNKSIDEKNIWIVKPGQVTNRGRGITVCATLDEIKIRLKSKQKNSDGSLRTYILQKYIQKPLLYQKRKFDIRHYMLMTCINGCIKGYWYQQGYIRTTSTEYNIKNCKDLYTHLTNDAIQKNSADYGKFQKGNKISYEDFQKYLVKNNKKDFNFFQKIIPKMKRLATDAMRATYSIIEPNRRENNFQLFGLDFMLDENMKVYLIECNTNPCLQLSCPLLQKIISGLIENVFKICIDPIFPPPFEWPNSKKFQLGEDTFKDMKFQIVFDEICDGSQLEKLYRNEKGFGEKMGKVQQDDQEYEESEEEKEWNEDSNV